MAWNPGRNFPNLTRVSLWGPRQTYWLERVRLREQDVFLIGRQSLTVPIRLLSKFLLSYRISMSSHPRFTRVMSRECMR